MKASFNKVISILLMAVLALFAVSFALATADTELTLQVGDASFDTQSSSYVSVPVSVTQNEQGFIDMQFSIKFDENVFESINSVVIPSDSMLYYAQDAKNPDNKVKPTVIAGADNAKGLVRVVMSGVFQKNLSGIRLVELCDQVEGSRLSAAAFPHQTHSFSGIYYEAHIL